MSAGQTDSTATSKTVQTVNPNRNKMPTAAPIIANGQSQIHERQRPRLIMLFVGFTVIPVNVSLVQSRSLNVFGSGSGFSC